MDTRDISIPRLDYSNSYIYSNLRRTPIVYALSWLTMSPILAPIPVASLWNHFPSVGFIVATYLPRLDANDSVMYPSLLGEDSQIVESVDRCFLVVPHPTISFFLPGSIDLISKVMPCSIPKWWPNGNGPTRGNGWVISRDSAYLKINFTSGWWDEIVFEAWDQNASREALITRHSHVSSEGWTSIKSLSRIFWLWQFGHWKGQQRWFNFS